jgi:ubiquinol oxidase
MIQETGVASVPEHKEHYHHKSHDMSDAVARTIVRFSAACADVLFRTRYGHRAVVLETIAAVPGMVGGLLQHLKSLRFIRDDARWIQTLLEEAENERMHLLIYNKIVCPTSFERLLIMIIQFFFYHTYFLLYLLSAKTAHRVVGYFEEEAIHSYETYLRLIESGVYHNIDAPDIAKKYWNLADDAKLVDVVKATIKDESIHRDVNHAFANDTRASFWR